MSVRTLPTDNVDVSALSSTKRGMPLRASAQVPDYYKGKTLIINIAGSPAGGHTRFARMLAP